MGFKILFKKLFVAQLITVALLLFSSNQAQAGKPFPVLDSLKTTRVWHLSMVLPGSGQFINRQYWKIPVFYSGMGSMAYFGYRVNLDYLNLKSNFNPASCIAGTICYQQEQIELKRLERNLFYSGAAAFYLASVADAVFVHAGIKHSPATATILSTIVPGLGQVYNGSIWKVPIVYGGFASLYYIINFNNRGYKRFYNAYQLLNDEDPTTIDEFNGLRNKDELKYYAVAYKRNRDLAFLGIIAFYALNVIDANVDAHLLTWDVSDNLAMSIRPNVGTMFANGSGVPKTTMGLSFGVTIK